MENINEVISMYKRFFIQFAAKLFILYFILLPFSFPMSSYAKTNTQAIMQIKVNDGLLSVKLVDASIKKTLEKIAHQANLQVEGLEGMEGKITQQFKNLPLDEGIKKIGKNFIMILKKSGEGDTLNIEKVFIVAEKEMLEPTKVKKVPPARKTVANISSRDKKQRVKSTPKPKVHSKIKKTEHPKAKEVEPKITKKKKKVAETISPKNKKPIETESKEKVSSRKKKVATNKAIPSPKISSLVKQGENYFNKKRWDKAIKYFSKYLGQNPSDAEIQEMLETAKQNAAQAINLYKQARALEKNQELDVAYELYKKTYDIYPLLYDTWEKMRSLKRKIKK